MRLDLVETRGTYAFTRERVQFALPPAGVVLVRGENGAGKSALIECMTFGLFGRTLRGKRPWNAGFVEAETGYIELRGVAPDGRAFSIIRTQRGGRAHTSFAHAGAAEVEYENNRKAQDDITAFTPVTWDGWRTSHVLTSATAAAFTRATDSERKALVEHMMGASALGAAYVEARALDVAAAAALRTAQENERAAAAALQWARDALAQHETTVVADLEAITGELAAARESLAAAKAAEDELRASADWWRRESDVAAVLAAEPAWAAARHEAAEAQRAWAAAQGVGDAQRAQLARHEATPPRELCATCGQRVEGAAEHHAREAERLREALAQALGATATACRAYEAAREAVGRVEAEAAARCAPARARFDATTSELMRAITAKAAAVQRLAAVEGERAQALRAQKRDVEALRAALTARVDAHEVAELAMVAAEREKAARAAVAAVLSPSAVRARLLTNALRVIADVANHWLGQLAATRLMSVALRLDDDKRESIALTIEGAGGAEGYPALSVGEQRRVDVALLLALAECTRQTGAWRSTSMPLVFDEVFDGLDVKGTEALASLVGTFARQRPVIVVSHSPLLREVLRSEHLAGAYEVRDGAILAG